MIKFLSTLTFAFVLLLAGCAGEATETADADHGDEMESMDNPIEMSLNSVRANLASTLEGLTEEQLTFKESDDRWSILEVTEHIMKADQMVSSMISDMVAAGPNPELAPDSALAVEMITGGLADRTQKFKTTDEFVPTGMFDSADTALAAFDEARSSLLETVANHDLDLTQYYAAHPVFGVIDGTKWIAFGTAHGERHLGQIAEIMQHENYPGS